MMANIFLLVRRYARQDITRYPQFSSVKTEHKEQASQNYSGDHSIPWHDLLFNFHSLSQAFENHKAEISSQSDLSVSTANFFSSTCMVSI